MNVTAGLLVLICATQSAATQPAPPSAQVTTTASPISLPDLERIALESNPTLRAAQAQIDAARGRARQAGAWPNPIAGFTAEEIKLGEQDKRGEYGFFVDQTIVLGGKLRLGRAVFERAAEGAE